VQGRPFSGRDRVGMVARDAVARAALKGQYVNDRRTSASSLLSVCFQALVQLALRRPMRAET